MSDPTVENVILSTIALLDIPEECLSDERFIQMSADYVNALTMEFYHSEGLADLSLARVRSGMDEVVHLWRTFKDLPNEPESEPGFVPTPDKPCSLDSSADCKCGDTYKSKQITLALFGTDWMGYRPIRNADGEEGVRPEPIPQFVKTWMHYYSYLPKECDLLNVFLLDGKDKSYVSFEVTGPEKKVVDWLLGLPRKPVEGRSYHLSNRNVLERLLKAECPPAPKQESEPEQQPEQQKPERRFGLAVNGIRLELLDYDKEVVWRYFGHKQTVEAGVNNHEEQAEVYGMAWRFARDYTGFPAQCSFENERLECGHFGRIFLLFNISGPEERIAEWLRGLNYGHKGRYRVITTGSMSSFPLTDR